MKAQYKLHLSYTETPLFNYVLNILIDRHKTDAIIQNWTVFGDYVNETFQTLHKACFYIVFNLLLQICCVCVHNYVHVSVSLRRAAECPDVGKFLTLWFYQTQ